MYVGTYAVVCLWRPEDNSEELVFPVNTSFTNGTQDDLDLLSQPTSMEHIPLVCEYKLMHLKRELDRNTY